MQTEEQNYGLAGENDAATGSTGSAATTAGSATR